MPFLLLFHILLNLPSAIILYGEDQRAVAEGVVHRMVKRAVELEGTVTGEHGCGMVKRDYLPHEVGETTVDTMRRVSLGHAFRILVVSGINSS